MRDNLTPKMHTVDDSFTDVTASLTFFQRTYYRDLQLCVRTQPFEKGGGPGDGIFTSTTIHPSIFSFFVDRTGAAGGAGSAW